MPARRDPRAASRSKVAGKLGSPRASHAARSRLKAADPVLGELIATVGRLPPSRTGRPERDGPLRRARALDRRPAAVGARRSCDLRASDGALRRAHTDTRADPRRGARRAARGGRAVARQGELSAVARRARRSRASWSWRRSTSSATTRRWPSSSPSRALDLDRAHVPHVPPRSPRRAARLAIWASAARSNAHTGWTRCPTASRWRRSPSHGGHIGRSPAATCGARCSNEPT